MIIKRIVRGVLRKSGYDLVSYDPVNHPVARQLRLLSSYGIDTVLDVGANVGQYARRLRATGYSGRILSFEPLPEAFAQAEKAAQGDERWQVVNVALGDRDGSAEINVSANLQSSSLLDMEARHLAAAPESRYVRRQTIQVVRLDSIADQFCRNCDRIFMKVDAQGYERKILEGASETLPRMLGVQLELSLVPLYEGETLLHEMIPLMTDLGFTLMSVAPSYGDRNTGQLLQVDASFFVAR